MDNETKQVLASICEILRSEIMRSMSVDNSMVAVARTLLKEDPARLERYEKEWTSATFSSQEPTSPQASENLRRLGELIQRLKE